MKDKLDKAENNYESLKKGYDSVVTKNGQLAVRTLDLQEDLKSYLKENKDLKQKIKDLQVKPGDVNSVSQGQVVIRVKDTVFLHKEDSAFVGRFEDAWTKADFVVKDSLLSFSYTTTDSLMIVHYGQKERFSILHPFRKRKISYYTIAQLTRPGSSVAIKSVQFK